MAELEIIGAPQSTFVRATRMALEEKRVPYKLTPAFPQSPEMLALHPYGKIPAMRHGDFTLFESRAIIFYADRVFEGPRLVPDDPKTAARAEQWASAIASSAFPALFAYMRENFFASGGRRNEAAVAASLPNMRKHIDILEEAAGGGNCLAGETFTIADLYLMPLLDYLRALPESGAMLGANLTRYFKRHCERPCFTATTPPAMGAAP